MAENKTVPTDASVEEFIAGVEHSGRRSDATELTALMKKATGQDPVMWGPSIIGFGHYRYRYDSGREGEMPTVGFSPRKSNLALYLMAKPSDYEARLKTLGKHKSGASCLYLNRLDDVDRDALEKLIADSWSAASS